MDIECCVAVGGRAHGLSRQATTVQSMENPLYGEHLFLRRAPTAVTHKGDTIASIALTGHLDTVFPAEVESKHDFRWREAEDGSIRGPGVVVRALRRGNCMGASLVD